MIGTLSRYWLFPAFWRRLPRLVCWVLALLLVGISLGLTAIPLLVWWENGVWSGFDGLYVALFYQAYLFFISVSCALAGATTIASEREQRTWESIRITPIGLRAIVRTKYLCRVARCMGILGFMMPFWLAWALQVLEVNHVGPASQDAASGLETTRMSLFLAWLGVRTVGHAIPFVALGVAVSACCRRVRTALSVSVSALLAYGLFVWGLNHTLFYWLLEVERQSMSSVLLWPLLPNDWQVFTPQGIVSEKWRVDLMADAVWMIVLPWLLYRFAVWQCRVRVA